MDELLYLTVNGGTLVAMIVDTSCNEQTLCILDPPDTNTYIPTSFPCPRYCDIVGWGQLKEISLKNSGLRGRSPLARRTARCWLVLLAIEHHDGSQRHT